MSNKEEAGLSEMMIEAKNSYDEELFVQGRCFLGRLGTTTFYVRRPVASVIRDTLESRNRNVQLELR